MADPTASPTASSTASPELPPPPVGAVPLALPGPRVVDRSEGALVEGTTRAFGPDEASGVASRPFLPDPGTRPARQPDWVDRQPVPSDPADALRARLAERTDTGPWLPPIRGATAAVQAPVPPANGTDPAPTTDGTDVGAAASEPPEPAATTMGGVAAGAATVGDHDTGDLDEAEDLDETEDHDETEDLDGPATSDDLAAFTVDELEAGPRDADPLDAGPDTGTAVRAPGSPDGPSDAPTADGDDTDPRRAAAVLGALIAVALGFASVLWLTRGDDTSTGASTAATAPPGTVVPAATAPPTTAAAIDPPATAAPDTTAPDTTAPDTTAPDTTAPDTTAPEVVPTTVADLPISVPADGVAFTDPAGWTLAVAPTWAPLEADGSTAWLTGVTSPTFTDRVDVTVETVDPDLSLDEYVTALWAQVVVGFPDATLVDRVRVVGDDGVRREVLTWTGTLPGGPPRAFVQAIAVEGSRAATATLTTEPDRVRPQALLVGPYLASVRPA